MTGAGPRPLHPQTTLFRRREKADMVINGTATSAWRRSVGDGRLNVLVADEPLGWHLSISHVLDTGRPGRYPIWDEITHARYQLLPTDAVFAIILPPPADYIACHPTTFHLHQIDWPPKERPRSGSTDETPSA